MCTGNPTELLARAMATSNLTPEHRQKFEDDFDHFCAYSGVHPNGVVNSPSANPLAWLVWAYWCGRKL